MLKSQQFSCLYIKMQCFAKLLLAVFALDVLLVFGNLALAYVGKTVVLVVLTVVETYALTVFRHSHRDAEVDEPIA